MIRDQYRTKYKLEVSSILLRVEPDFIVQYEADAGSRNILSIQFLHKKHYKFIS